MPRATHSRTAHAQRCIVVCDATGMPHASGEDFVRNVLNRFGLADPRRSGETAEATIAYLLYAAFLGRLPKQSEIAPLLSACAKKDCAEIAHFFFALPEFHAVETRSLALSVPPVETLLVDVTHTTAYRHTSGIQRVVRSLCNAIRSHGAPPLFIRFCKSSMRFVPLSAEDVAGLVSPRNDSGRKRRLSQATSRWIKGAKAHFKRNAHPRVASFASASVRMLKSSLKASAHVFRRLAAKSKRLISREKSWSHDTVSVFVWNHTVLLPELAADPHHIDSLAVVLTSSETRSTMIVYDLLPIQHPEWFPASLLSGYLAYLKLLRHVDAISCISAAVKDDVTRLMHLVCRRKPAPTISHHYLGADFAVDAEASQPVSPRTTPVVLCVGTIEPRKNQARILEAMTLAQKRGCRFTGVFVGNAGWLNGHFRSCLQDAIRGGCDIVLHEHVSDATLAALYHDSAFTIYCSLAEGFGLPIIESVMRGKPCITSDRGSMKEIGEQIGGCVFVDPENVDDMSALIQRLLEDPETSAGLASAAELATWTTWQEYATAIRTFAEFADIESPCSRVLGDTRPTALRHLQRTA
jgi:glycosyltransferase involved in cell wall biosynthesis